MAHLWQDDLARNKERVCLDLSEINKKQGEDGTENHDKTGIEIERHPERRRLAEAITAARKRAEEDQQQAAIAEGPDETGFSVQIR